MRKIIVLLGSFLCVSVFAQDVMEQGGAEAPDLFARDTYRVQTMVCPFKSRIEYEPGEIECGLLQVPENREKPDSRFIDLHFIKLNSTWDDEEEMDEDEYDASIPAGKRDDPVIYLTGGPGAVAEGYVDRFKDHRLRHHRDLYILEQRGIANSADFCLTYYSRMPELGDVGTLEEAAAASRERSAECARNAMAAGVDLSGYSTIENARDVKALRVALGYEQWNVWGISYGSILGQAYIKEDPEGILAVAIDAIVPLDTRADPITWRVVNWYDRDLEKLNELCQADSNCADAFPDLGERVRDAARATAGNAIEVEVSETEVFPSGKAYFMSDIATFLPFTLFYEQDNYPALPAIIHAWADTIEARDETTFKALALGLASSGGIFGGSQGMYDAIMCNDGFRVIAVDSFAVDRAEFPVLTNAVFAEGDAEGYVEVCESLGLTARPREDYAAVQTDIPTLIIEGDMDPITPPPLAHEILPGFANGTYVEFPYAGHGPSRSVECGGDLLNKFYDDPTAEPDLSCVDEMEVPEFIGPLHRMSFGPKFAVLALENKDEMPKVALWGGFSVFLVLVGFLVLTFAPLVRRFDKRQPAPAGRARVATWAAALLGVLALCILGAAGAVTSELSEILMLFGMVGWAAWGSWFGVLGGVVGVVALFMTVQARRELALPNGTLIGFLLVNLAALSLSLFMVVWGLGP